MAAQWELVAHDAGNTLMARTIRYIEDRRAEESRFTGAIERHPSPLGVVWGAEDPVAVLAMTERLARRRVRARRSSSSTTSVTTRWSRRPTPFTDAVFTVLAAD